MLKTITDIKVRLVSDITSWISDGFIFYDKDGNNVISIMYNDPVGVTLTIGEKYVNKDNKEIWNGSYVKPIHCLKDFTYDKFNPDAISMDTFKTLQELLLNEELLPIDSISIHILSADFRKDKEELIQHTKKLLDRVEEMYAKYISDLKNCG